MAIKVNGKPNRVYLLKHERQKKEKQQEQEQEQEEGEDSLKANHGDGELMV